MNNLGGSGPTAEWLQDQSQISPSPMVRPTLAEHRGDARCVGAQSRQHAAAKTGECDGGGNLLEGRKVCQPVEVDVVLVENVHDHAQDGGEQHCQRAPHRRHGGGHGQPVCLNDEVHGVSFQSRG